MVVVILFAKGALFYVKREHLVDFYEEHNPANVSNVDAILQHYSAQQILDTSQERYGAQPATTAKAKGALAILDIHRNNIPRNQQAILKRICNSKSTNVDLKLYPL